MSQAGLFRTSFCARMLTAAAAFALIAGGLIAVLHGPKSYFAIPFFGAPALSLVAFLFGAERYPGIVAALAMVLPIAFWGYVMLALGAYEQYPAWGWALVAVGFVPPLFQLVAEGTTRQALRPGAAAASPGASESR